uniref:Uncharacterized protein n=1 Tax=Anopheles dirus TaxID=7168 RepID=A0A182NW44_9DIPT
MVHVSRSSTATVTRAQRTRDER